MEQLSRRDWLGATALTAVATALGATDARAQAPIDGLLGAVKNARLFDLSFVWIPS